MRADELYDVGSEAAVVASLVFHPTFYFQREQLTPHHFTDESNGYLFYAISELAKRNISEIDAYNIWHILESKDVTKRNAEIITPLSAIKEFIDTASLISRETEEEYNMVADAVLDCAFRREICTALDQCKNLCKSTDSIDLEQRIYEILDKVILDYSSTNELPLYGDIVEDVWSEIVSRQKGETPMVEFPFPALNQYVVMEPGELICFTGAAKSGKSAMLLTCAMDLLKKGHRVLYIDSELSTRLFTTRAIAHLANVRFGDVRTGNYDATAEANIRSWLDWFKRQKFIHVYMPIFDENSILIAAKRAKHMIDIDCIIVDYLKSAGKRDEAFAVYAEMGRITDTLKNKICGSIGLIGLTGAQATSTGRIADSARIARSVSTVISITDKKSDEIERDGQECGNKKLRVVFNRNGNQMLDDEYIDMDFDGSHVMYRQAQKQHEVEDPY